EDHVAKVSAEISRSSPASSASSAVRSSSAPVLRSVLCGALFFRSGLRSVLCGAFFFRSGSAKRPLRCALLLLLLLLCGEPPALTRFASEQTLRIDVDRDVHAAA